MANFDFTYFRHACASALVSNDPMVMKVCVTATCGSASSGFANDQGRSLVEVPTRAARSGATTLNLSKFSGPVM